MNAALMLLALAAAGQAGWTPERSAAPPPAAAPSYDRYAQPPAGSYAPPPGVVDRTRTAVEQSGTTLREGVEAGIQAANQQLQGWTDSAGRQLQTTGNNLRTAAEQALGAGGSSSAQVSNPFGTSTSPASAATTTRGGVAPPPWNTPSASSAPNWDVDSSQADASPGLPPLRTDNGWTSIGSHVAAPQMQLPRLSASAAASMVPDGRGASGPALSMPASGNEPLHNLLGNSTRESAAPAAGWATGWGDAPAAPPATISRTAADTSPRTAVNVQGTTAAQSPNSAAPNSQPPPSNNWADLWGDEDPWADSNQAPVAPPATQNVASTASPNANHPSQQNPVLGIPANAAGPALGAPSGEQQPVLSVATRPQSPSQDASQNEPPWLPLLIVSVSLAGSLGANLFLGWSYIDARHRYQSLVRKTAEKFRLAVTAAA